MLDRDRTMGVNLFSSMTCAMLVAIGRASGHFPKRAFIASSQATTALTRILVFVPGDVKRAGEDRFGLSSTHQKKA